MNMANWLRAQIKIGNGPFPILIWALSSARNFRRVFVFLLLLAAWPQAGLGSNFYQGVATNSLYWPGGIIPYKFDTNVTTAEQTIYLDGMKEWELAANVHFVPYSNQADYVLLRVDYAQGTDTFVLSPPESVLTVDTLSRAQVGHETGHLLGFQHEHVRTDRNTYITVNFTNLIDSGNGGGTNGSGEGSSISNLYVIDTNSTLFGAYDFESVMHYSRTLFSTNPDVADTIDPNAPYYAKYYYRIGNYALSPGDRAGAAYLYGSPTNALTNVVTNTADVGPGTLRAALYYANDHPGTTVRFNIPTSDPGFSNGVYTIYLTGELPPLAANGTVIDATTQPGYTSHPVIALSGSQLNPELAYPGTLFQCGLRVYAANCTIDGLSIHDFPFVGIEVEYAFAVSNRIEGCYLGVAPNSTNAAGNVYQGVSIDTGASYNIVGGTNVNVISGNTQYGVIIVGTNGLFGATKIGTNTFGNAVQNSWVGLDATGTHAVSNLLGGIWVFNSATGVTIGGTNAGAGNVISGNGSAGVFLLGVSNNVVQGNYIGLNAAGTGAVSNADSGVYVVGGSTSNLIGGTTPGARNVISGNHNYGIYVSDAGTRNVVVQGNYLGTDPRGLTAIGNGFSGIGVWNTATNVLVGGTNAGAGNLISGNNDGVNIGGTGTTGVQVFGNFVGTTSNGLAVLPNTNIGVYLEQGTQGNSIGGALPGAGNLISGNGTDGVQLHDDGTSFNTIQGNLIGTTKTGLAPLGNNGVAVSIYLGTGNTVGGTTAAARNVLCASTNEGIFLYFANNQTIQGNYIGVGADGATPMGNGLTGFTQPGIYVEGGAGNLIGGTTAGAGNVVADNGNDGVQIYGPGANFNVVQGNLIGTTATGLAADGNGGSGISLLYGPVSNTVGGATAAARNVVSGNLGTGVLLAGASNTIVEGNYIGTDSTGLAKLGNGFEGIVLQQAATANQIGGAAAGQGNVICANTYHGLYISDAGTTGNVVQGNNIGVGANGTTALGNGFQGVLLQGGASQNVVGLALNGSGTGNLIANNTYEGIIVYDAITVGNSLRGNSIFGNGDLGINLVGGTEILDGVTVNHTGGPVPGPNDLQNYPVLTATAVASGVTTIYSTLNSAPNHSYLVDVYRNTTADSSGYGQGQVYVGSANLATDAGGNGFFAMSTPGSFAGQHFTATATDAATGDGSEFGLDLTATNGNAPFVLFGPYSWNTTSGFTLNLAVPTNQNYTIQTTTNLAAKPIVWTSLTNFTSTSLNTQFVDHSATNHAIPIRFYRVVSP
jgi:Astacin (Peptidase family M12A)